MKIQKIIGVIFLVVGMLLITYGGYMLLSGSKAEDKSQSQEKENIYYEIVDDEIN